MFKLFVLAAFIAVAAARPGYLGGSQLAYSGPIATTYVQEPAYAHVGSVIKSIPTAVSHQSISQVHSSAHYVEPIVAPVLKTYSTPVYAHAAPVVKTIASPLVHSSYGAAPYVNSAYATYESSPLVKTSYAAAYAPNYAGSYGGAYGSHTYGGAAW